MLGIAKGGGIDIAGILGTVARGAVGGGVLMAIIGFVKGLMKK
jgi:hypothetical protein